VLVLPGEYMISLKAAILFFGLVVMAGGFWRFFQHKTAGTVVVLNGTSSAGKTSILRELKNIHGVRIKVTNLDSFIDSYRPTHPMTQFNSLIDEYAKKLPAALKSRAQDVAWTDEPIKQKLDKLAEEYDKTMLGEFYESVRRDALKGENIIIDTVLQGTKRYDQCVSILRDINPKMVLLYCPLGVTVQRVKQRNLA
jgi:chloramphenicol 3-O-phosphotransferase